MAKKEKEDGLTAPLQIRLTPSEKAEFDELTEKKSINKSNLLRQYIKQWLRENR